MEAIRAAIADLSAPATKAQTDKLSSDLARRQALHYGRVYINGSLTSLEYYLAHFGSPPPLTAAPIVLADPIHACGPLKNPNVTGAIVIAKRGRCTFVDKASNVSTANASVLLIGNLKEEIFRVSAGYAVGDKPLNISLPSNITVALVKASAFRILKRAVSFVSSTTPAAQMIPLLCGEGRSVCEPATDADKAYLESHAMDSGHVIIQSTGERFEYVSAAFGGVLPLGPINVTTVSPSHACGMIPAGPLRWAYYATMGAAWDYFRGNGLSRGGTHVAGTLALVDRGLCPLGQKALNVQAARAGGLIVASESEVPIQPFGATSQVSLQLEMPAIMVTYQAGQRLRELMKGGSGRGGFVTVSLVPARPGMADKWLEVSERRGTHDIPA